MFDLVKGRLVRVIFDHSSEFGYVEGTIMAFHNEGSGYLVIQDNLNAFHYIRDYKEIVGL